MQSLGVDPQPGMLRLIENPLERDPPQAALLFRISPARVRVHAGKPALFEVLLGASLLKQILPEECPTLVERDGVSDGLDTRITHRKRVPLRVPDPAHGRHRVPDADKPDGKPPLVATLHGPAERPAEVVADLPVLVYALAPFVGFVGS